MSSNAEYQRQFRQRMKEQGLSQVCDYVPAAGKREFRWAATMLREGESLTCKSSLTGKPDITCKTSPPIEVQVNGSARCFEFEDTRALLETLADNFAQIDERLDEVCGALVDTESELDQLDDRIEAMQDIGDECAEIDDALVALQVRLDDLRSRREKVA